MNGITFSLAVSLSLGSGAVVVALCSALLAWPLSYVLPAVVRWLLALGVPALVAFALYWLPVLLGSSDAAQYSAWQFLVLGVWFLAGLTASVMVTLLLGRGRSR